VEGEIRVKRRCKEKYNDGESGFIYSIFVIRAKRRTLALRRHGRCRHYMGPSLRSGDKSYLLMITNIATSANITAAKTVTSIRQIRVFNEFVC
jgi:hypothetical protein